MDDVAYHNCNEDPQSGQCTCTLRINNHGHSRMCTCWTGWILIIKMLSITKLSISLITIFSHGIAERTPCMRCCAHLGIMHKQSITTRVWWDVRERERRMQNQLSKIVYRMHKQPMVSHDCICWTLLYSLHVLAMCTQTACFYWIFKRVGRVEQDEKEGEWRKKNLCIER